MKVDGFLATRGDADESGREDRVDGGTVDSAIPLGPATVDPAYSNYVADKTGGLLD